MRSLLFIYGSLIIRRTRGIRKDKGERRNIMNTISGNEIEIEIESKSI